MDEIKLDFSLYERMQFLENDISREKRNMDRWLEYAEGKHNLHAEFSYIFRCAEAEILEIREVIEEKPEDLANALDYFYDNHHYDFDSIEDLSKNFEMILRNKAIDDFHYEVKLHSPDSARVLYTEAKDKYYNLKDSLDWINKNLSLKQKWELRREKKRREGKSKAIKKSGSPSTIFAEIGECGCFGMANGLFGGMDNIEEIKKMIEIFRR